MQIRAKRIAKLSAVIRSADHLRTLRPHENFEKAGGTEIAGAVIEIRTSTARITRFDLSRHAAWRQPAHIDEGGTGIELRFLLKGAVRLSQHGRTIDAQARDAFILSSNAPWSYISHSPVEFIAVHLAVAQLSEFARAHVPVLSGSILDPSPMLNAIETFLADILRQVHSASEAHIAASVDQIGQMLNALMVMYAAEKAAPLAAEPSDYERAIQLIALHSAETSFTSERLAMMLGRSPRSLQRLFELEGDRASKAIRNQRLVIFATNLTEFGKDLDIATIAARSGFTKADTAARAFKEFFGVSPRDYLFGERRDAAEE